MASRYSDMFSEHGSLIIIETPVENTFFKTANVLLKNVILKANCDFKVATKVLTARMALHLF